MLALDLRDRVEVRARRPRAPRPPRRSSSRRTPGPSANSRSWPSIAVIVSSIRSRVASRASSSTSCSAPSVFSSVRRNSSSLSPVCERAHLLEVGARVGADHLADRLVGERLGEAQQRQAGGHPLEVPGEVPEVGLVEVVDVEDEDPGGVHVGAVVLRVQVALDPDAARALVGPAVLEVGDVGVEQAGAAAVERERVGGHLAELAPERLRVGLDEVLEGVDEHLHDLLLARVAVAAQVLERSHGAAA